MYRLNFRVIIAFSIIAVLQCLIVIPYMAKLLSGKTFAVFQPITKVFPLNHLLCTVHDGHGLMHCESFPVNSVFCAQPRKFSHLKVLPYALTLATEDKKPGTNKINERDLNTLIEQSIHRIL